MADDLLQLAQQFLPLYLLPGHRQTLLESIGNFPHHRGYYTDIDRPDYLQGDGWTSLTVFDFGTAERKSVTGIVLSNSCDVTAENEGNEVKRIVFAPIIKLSRYVDLLLRNGRSQAQVDNTLDRLRKQHDNNIFYLPSHGEMEEGLITFDNVHSEPLNEFWTANKRRVVRLSDFGFWLFVLKLSMNFSRLQEAVSRGALTEA